MKPFPISIDFPNVSEDKNGNNEKDALMKNLGIKTKYIGLGVDRLDYTKGILERLKSVEIFLNRYPAYKGNFTFIQIAAPSRTIVLLEKHHDHTQIQKYYRSADFCLVTSLHDGMNLVAKEFVASRELKDALIINPYNGEQTAEAIREALEMLPKEQTKRMRNMREVVKNYNVYRWSADLLKTIVGLG